MKRALTLWIAAALALVARAAPAAPPPPGPPDVAGADADDYDDDVGEEGSSQAATEDRLHTVEGRLDRLEQTVIFRQPRVTLSGFIDVGFFAVQGDGTGFVQDSGPAAARHFPAHADRFAWVFLGDLLSTAVNTRGEPADLGNPPGITRFDSVASRLYKYTYDDSTRDYVPQLGFPVLVPTGVPVV